MKVLYLFGKFSDQDIDWVIGAGTREDIPTGRTLIEEGTPVERLYITLSGSFRVTSHDKLIASIGPGEAVGELSFLDSLPPAATVTAVEDSVVVSFSMKRLRTKLRLDQGFASRFYHALSLMLADRMRRDVQHLALSDSLDDDTIADGQIPPSLLEDTGLAGTLFDKLRHAFLPSSVTICRH